MNLHIDTSQMDRISIDIDSKHFEATSKKRKAQYLLEFIDSKLSELGESPKAITSITINKGPGSFTGLRVGATVAATLGWSLGIPVDTELQLV